MKSFQPELVYDRLAPFYDAWTVLTEKRPQLEALKAANLGPGESILEVAVGTAMLLAQIMQVPGLRLCVGMDLSSGMLGRARQRLVSTLGQGGQLCKADARRLPFPDGAFDAILSCYMLDLLSEEDIPIVLGEFQRVLNCRGRLVLVNMARQSGAFNKIWMGIYRRSPSLVGGCRPVIVSPVLESGGWRLDRDEIITQNGFRSELIVARPMGRTKS
ncbi:MAG: methyltransferase domain-containing protein [Acidobacteria bacterium]|nr:methyltransferase domain-containing protein [Acidobacteriota bacterium]